MGSTDRDRCEVTDHQGHIFWDAIIGCMRQMNEVFPGLVSDTVLVCGQSRSPSLNAGGGHLVNSVGLTKQEHEGRRKKCRP